MNIIKKEKIMSVSMYLGQVSKSIDNVRKSIAIDITKGRTFNSKRLLENITKEKKTKIIFKAIKAFCHSIPNNNLDIAIKRIGNV